MQSNVSGITPLMDMEKQFRGNGSPSAQKARRLFATQFLKFANSIQKFDDAPDFLKILESLLYMITDSCPMKNKLLDLENYDLSTLSTICSILSTLYSIDHTPLLSHYLQEQRHIKLIISLIYFPFALQEEQQLFHCMILLNDNNLLDWIRLLSNSAKLLRLFLQSNQTCVAHLCSNPLYFKSICFICAKLLSHMDTIMQYISEEDYQQAISNLLQSMILFCSTSELPVSILECETFMEEIISFFTLRMHYDFYSQLLPLICHTLQVSCINNPKTVSYLKEQTPYFFTTLLENCLNREFSISKRKSIYLLAKLLIEPNTSEALQVIENQMNFIIQDIRGQNMEALNIVLDVLNSQKMLISESKELVQIFIKTDAMDCLIRTTLASLEETKLCSDLAQQSLSLLCCITQHQSETSSLFEQYPTTTIFCSVVLAGKCSKEAVESMVGIVTEMIGWNRANEIVFKNEELFDDWVEYIKQQYTNSEIIFDFASKFFSKSKSKSMHSLKQFVGPLSIESVRNNSLTSVPLSVEDLYKTFLTDVELRSTFRQYLQQQQSVEFLNYLVAIFYRFYPSNGDYMEAQYILHQFVEVGSEQELNIAYSLRNSVMERFESLPPFTRVVPLDLFDCITEYSQVFLYHEKFIPFKSSSHLYVQAMQNLRDVQRKFIMEKERFEKDNQTLQQCHSLIVTIQNKKWLKRTRRNRIIRGFMTSEQSYLHLLDSLVPKLVVFCRQNRKESNIADVVCRLLESVQKVKNISRALFEEILEGKKNISSKTELFKLPLANLLLSRIQYLKLYKVYADDFRTYFPKIVEQEEDPFFDRIDDFFSANCNVLERSSKTFKDDKFRGTVSCYRRLSLEKLLKMPLQRIIRYDQLLQKLILATRKKDEDKSLMKEASKQIHEIRAFCEKMLTGREMFVKI